MHSTYLRQEHIHGVLLGTAIGEALGLARNGMSRRSALKLYGRPPVGYRYLPRIGVYGDHTRLMLINAQALLNSRSDSGGLRRAFQGRLSWYLLSVPLGARKSIWKSAVRSWLSRFRLPSGVAVDDSSAASRAIFSTLAINGTGHRIGKWIEQSTQLTHTHPLAIDGCKVLARLADCAVKSPPGELNSAEALQAAIDFSQDADLREHLEKLQPLLAAGRSPSAVARQLGWSHGIDRHSLPATVMGAYCWLRYPNSFERAVGSAICLGGQTATLGAIVGGLVGAHIGYTQLPTKLKERLGGNPHGTEWISALADRFSHWPHGQDDLHMARAQTSEPMLQLLRNLFLIPFASFHWLKRLTSR